MLRGLKLALACTCTALVSSTADAALEDIPSFAVPSFDYGSLQNGDAPTRMLEALERGGIIALKNVPNYANVRERFLASAVQCAVASENADEGLRYLSTKQFHDGTRRLTLRAAAGRELLDTDSESLNAMAANCPGHRELYEDFSSTLERAVDTFASALDQSAFTMGDGERHISARKLVGDAKRLDHFHAYEAAPASAESSSRRSLSAQEIERDLSLAMHEDHGLFIAMAAPKFFAVNANDGSIRERRLKSDASGLVIGAAELDEIVRPELKADELVIMIGTGASRWLATSHHLPPVMHGMRMPEEMVWDDDAAPGQRNLRAWFGKMTLLPAYQRLLETNMYFDEFTNRTTRHLLANGNANDELKAIGCAGGRHLVESEGSCTYSICTLKAGVERPPTVGCNQACNYHTEFFDAKCENKCDCTGTTTQADVCWMLCVARLPVNECALEDQECSGLKMICSANSTDANATAAPAATTEAPASMETPLPTTMSGETPVPTATAAETPIPTETIATDVPTPAETLLPTTAPLETVEPSTALPTDAPTFTVPTTAPMETPLPATIPAETPLPTETLLPTTAPLETVEPSTALPIEAPTFTAAPSLPTTAPMETPLPITIPAETPLPAKTIATHAPTPAETLLPTSTPLETVEPSTALPTDAPTFTVPTTAPMETPFPATSLPASEVPTATHTPLPTMITPVPVGVETNMPTTLPAATEPSSATGVPTTEEEPAVPGGHC
ncbi:hypothetical protein PHYPSEUDO_014310 [Phytophthora pseudosyringae]|uniref:Uncharacterized protein n=1 Tax=Phytophthora pseudosyringae TaxID=221518 RepID=A0A8T1WLF8_9STRA|nr:hypothetical protein PHYPSEUDO_014310 [Phytophthora pseudosyringae]